MFDARAAPPGLPRSRRASRHDGALCRAGLRRRPGDRGIDQGRFGAAAADGRFERSSPAPRRPAPQSQAVDSDQWYAEVLRKRIDGVRGKSPGLKPTELPSDSEVRFWLRQFGLEDGETSPRSSAESPPDSPFPPGYGEDVREEDL